MSDVKWTGGTEHWTRKGDVKLFLWNKKAAPGVTRARSSSCTVPPWPRSRPSTCVPGRPFSSAMDWFAQQGFDTWTMDNEGYGRSDKHRPINSDIGNGADDLEAGTRTCARPPARSSC